MYTFDSGAESEFYSPFSGTVAPDSAESLAIGRSAALDNPLSAGDIPVPAVPAVPNPSAGGMPGPFGRLEWTKGIRFNRWAHALLDGRTMVVPNMGVHPVVGDVGFSNRQNRLEIRTAALYGQYTPTNEETGAMFAARGTNQGLEMIGGAENAGAPNYV